MLYDLYKIKDKDLNVIYIGITKKSKGYEKRFNEHKKAALSATGESRTLIHLRMKEGGVDNFTCVLMLHDIPSSKIGFYEQLWIKKYNTFYKDNLLGCNMTRGGNGATGYQFTDEARHNVSLGSKRYWKRVRNNPEEYMRLCQKRSQQLKGVPKSAEHKKKLSEFAKTRTKEKNPFYGKHHNQYVKDILTEVHGYPVIMIDKITDEELKYFPSASKAGQYLQEIGVTSNKTPNGLILDACQGKVKSAYGYKWKLQKSVTTIPKGSNSEIATE